VPQAAHTKRVDKRRRPEIVHPAGFSAGAFVEKLRTPEDNWMRSILAFKSGLSMSVKTD
jgi:hypothetical protein